eukprot:COSAG05_NODE_27549_length_150_cov_119.431373_1_plen_23_part_10
MPSDIGELATRFKQLVNTGRCKQ